MKHFDENKSVKNTNWYRLQYYSEASNSSFFNMMTSSNGNIFCVTGHLCRQFTGHRWIPHTITSDAELWCFLWSAPELTIELTIMRLVIWDAIVPIMTSQSWVTVVRKYSGQSYAVIDLDNGFSFIQNRGITITHADLLSLKLCKIIFHFKI